MRNLGTLICLSLMVFVAVGCSKKADTSKPIDQIQKEVETMSVKDLESTARAYASEITKKTQEVDKVKEELKGFSPKDLLGEKAKNIKIELSKITEEMSALTKRYDIYLKKFGEMGGDISAVKVQR